MFHVGHVSDDSIEHLKDEDESVPGEELKCNCFMLYINFTGKLQLRNLIMHTKNAKHKWFELGIALKVPINILEELDEKYDGIPMKALIRVYRYWLNDENGLEPKWEKLIDALQRTDQYSISASIERYAEVSICCLSNAVVCICMNGKHCKQLKESKVLATQLVHYYEKVAMLQLSTYVAN